MDEIGELTLELQPKLLRVLQEREDQPLGSSRTEEADVRSVVATHRDLGAMCRAGTFRMDLLYRSNAFAARSACLIKASNGAAARLGLKRSTLNFKLKKLGITPSSVRGARSWVSSDRAGSV